MGNMNAIGDGRTCKLFKSCSRVRCLGGQGERGEHEGVGAEGVHTASWIYVRRMRKRRGKRRRELRGA